MGTSRSRRKGEAALAALTERVRRRRRLSAARRRKRSERGADYRDCCISASTSITFIALFIAPIDRDIFMMVAFNIHFRKLCFSILFSPLAIHSCELETGLS